MNINYFGELAKSRDAVIDLRSGQTVLKYIGQAVAPYTVSDDQDMIAYVQTVTPIRYGFQLRRTIAPTSLGGGWFTVDVTYGFDEGDLCYPVDSGDYLPYEFSFDTSGGTLHVTQSNATVESVKYGIPERTINDVNAISTNPVITSATAAFTQSDVGATVTSTTGGLIPANTTIKLVSNATTVALSNPAGATTGAGNLTITLAAPPNYNQAIGVTREGVQGVDKIVPKLEIQITRRFAGITKQYLSTLVNLTGTKNAFEFMGFDPGELLFMGASGAPSQNNQALASPEMRVTFKFAGVENKTNLDLVPDDANGNHLLRIPLKQGWDHLWVSYKDDVDPVSKIVRPRPDAAYVEEICDGGDWSELQIGTDFGG